MNRRPAGVTVCAIVLALAALFLVMSALFSGIAAALLPHMPAPAVRPGVPPVPPGLLLGIMVFSVLFYLLLAGWAGATVYGLFHMRNWARVSTIVIGAGLILAGLFGAFGMLMTQITVSSMPLPPNADPRILRVVLSLLAVFALCVMGVGVWWIIYFLLRKTANAFHLAEANRAGSIAASANLTQETTLGEVNDYQPSSLQDSQREVVYQRAPQVRSAKRPISVTVMAVLMLIGSFSALLQMLSALPLFLFGVTLSGWTAHIIMLLWCAINGVAGFGLLRLERPAWMLACGIFCLPVLNALAMLTPGSRSRFQQYMQSVMERSSFGLAQPVFPGQLTSIFAVIGVLIALIFSGVMLTLLWRAKWAFEPTTQHHAAV